MRPLDLAQLPGFIQGIAGEMDAAARIAGDEALKTVRAWTIAYVRNRKELREPKRITRALKAIKPRRGGHFSDLRWELRVGNAAMPMSAYPHTAVPGLGGGVRVEINAGKPTLVKHAFLARVGAVSKAGEVSLHDGVFVRTGKSSLPIRQLFSSSVADVLHDGSVKAELEGRAHEVFAATFARVLDNGVAKNLAATWAAKRRR